jgi:hypothetical protein
MVIRRFNPVSCARIAGVLYAVMGIFFGAAVSLFSTFGAFTPPDGGSRLPFFFGAAAIVVLPIFYGCLGFVTALVGATLYNILAGRVGGIELDLE